MAHHYDNGSAIAVGAVAGGFEAFYDAIASGAPHYLSAMGLAFASGVSYRVAVWLSTRLLPSPKEPRKDDSR